MRSVIIELGPFALQGDLNVPARAEGIVVFAHGSGSSRKSSRNRFVAERLQEAGLATLLLDLLTEEEERLDELSAELRFDIDLLTERVVGAIDWVLEHQVTRSLPLGLFGASTGAAAALRAAAERPQPVRAVVSRGGRADLAGGALEEVWAPTLLIVGGQDATVLSLNQEAFRHLASEEKRLEVITGATHLFEESGALEQVAELAREWLKFHLTARGEPEWSYA
jgi:putative phosphoribosyl transferase